MIKQTLPEWFKGEVYKEGATVANRFSGEDMELTAIELSIYDFVMGASIIMEMGMNNPGVTKDLRKGLAWFRTYSPEAYDVLLD